MDHTRLIEPLFRDEFYDGPGKAGAIGWKRARCGSECRVGDSGRRAGHGILTNDLVGNGIGLSAFIRKIVHSHESDGLRNIPILRRKDQLIGRGLAVRIQNGIITDKMNTLKTTGDLVCGQLWTGGGDEDVVGGPTR